MKFALVLAALAFSWQVASETPVPRLVGPIADDAGLLSAPDLRALERALLDLHHSGKAQMVIYIARSLDGRDIESYSLRLAEAWKLGKKGKDDGLLLVVAPNERKMRLEVGYGLEGDITDALSKQILSDTIAPYFRERRYGEGLMAAVMRVGQKLGVNVDAPVAPLRARGKSVASGVLEFIFLIFFLFIFLFSGWFMPRGRRRSGWGGSSGWSSSGGGSWSRSGGGFGGGGGGFGGGGASSSW